MYASDGSSTVFNASLGFQAQGTADFSNNSDTGYLSTGQANLNSSSQMQSYYEQADVRQQNLNGSKSKKHLNVTNYNVIQGHKQVPPQPSVISATHQG